MPVLSYLDGKLTLVKRIESDPSTGQALPTPTVTREMIHLRQRGHHDQTRFEKHGTDDPEAKRFELEYQLFNRHSHEGLPHKTPYVVFEKLGD